MIRTAVQFFTCLNRVRTLFFAGVVALLSACAVNPNAQVGDITGGSARSIAFSAPPGMVRVTDKSIIRTFAQSQDIPDTRLIGVFLEESFARNFATVSLSTLGTFLQDSSKGRGKVLVRRVNGTGNMTGFNAVADIFRNLSGVELDEEQIAEILDAAGSDSVENSERMRKKLSKYGVSVEESGITTSILGNPIDEDRVISVESIVSGTQVVDSVENRFKQTVLDVTLLTGSDLYFFQVSRNFRTKADREWVIETARTLIEQVM